MNFDPKVKSGKKSTKSSRCWPTNLSADSPTISKRCDIGIPRGHLRGPGSPSPRLNNPTVVQNNDDAGCSLRMPLQTLSRTCGQATGGCCQAPATSVATSHPATLPLKGTRLTQPGHSQPSPKWLPRLPEKANFPKATLCNNRRFFFFLTIHRQNKNHQYSLCKKQWRPGAVFFFFFKDSRWTDAGWQHG